MKKIYVSPVIEDLFVETSEILETSTIEVFTGEDAPEMGSVDVMSRESLLDDMFSGGTDGLLNLFN